MACLCALPTVPADRRWSRSKSAAVASASRASRAAEDLSLYERCRNQAESRISRAAPTARPCLVGRNARRCPGSHAFSSMAGDPCGCRRDSGGGGQSTLSVSRRCNRSTGEYIGWHLARGALCIPHRQGGSGGQRTTSSSPVRGSRAFEQWAVGVNRWGLKEYRPDWVRSGAARLHLNVMQAEFISRAVAGTLGTLDHVRRSSGCLLHGTCDRPVLQADQDRWPRVRLPARLLHTPVGGTCRHGFSGRAPRAATSSCVMPDPGGCAGLSAGA